MLGRLIKAALLRLMICAFVFIASAGRLYAAPSPDQANLSVSGLACDISQSSPEIVSLTGNGLVTIAKEYLQPPKIDTDNKSCNISAAYKLLPGLPATVLLGVFGFLCVTAVRDHKHWAAALAVAVCIGQMGIAALPNILARSQFRRIIKNSTCLICVPAGVRENSLRVRSKIEGSDYASLLRYLSSIPSKQNLNDHHLVKLQSAIVAVNDILPAYIKNAVINHRQAEVFSPAFIFSILSRGPPAVSQKDNFLFRNL